MIKQFLCEEMLQWSIECRMEEGSDARKERGKWWSVCKGVSIPWDGGRRSEGNRGGGGGEEEGREEEEGRSEGWMNTQIIRSS